MDSLKDLLPSVIESAGWRAQSAPQVFSGRELYGYMDGGADVVLEYGFSRVIVQDYKDAASRTITVEVFELDTPADAYGLYTFKTGPEGEARPIGAESRLADYYLNVWKGRYVVTLTGLDESPEVRAGLEAIGRAVASRITSSSGVPGIVSLLPAAGRLDGTVEYLRGRLALFQSLPYFSSDVFAFAAGAKGDYAGSLTLILLRVPHGCRGAGEARIGPAELPRESEVQRHGGERRRLRSRRCEGPRRPAQSQRPLSRHRPGAEPRRGGAGAAGPGRGASGPRGRAVHPVTVRRPADLRSRRSHARRS